MRTGWMLALIVLALGATACNGGGEAPGRLSADLQALNESGVDGTAVFDVTEDNQVAVSIELAGLVPNRIHELVLHQGAEEGAGSCTEAIQDRDEDGLIEQSELVGALGQPVAQVNPHPTLDDEGNVDFELTYAVGGEEAAFSLPGPVVEDLASHTLVVYGIDAPRPGAYAPEVPAACGALQAEPSGSPAGG